MFINWYWIANILFLNIKIIYATDIIWSNKLDSVACDNINYGIADICKNVLNYKLTVEDTGELLLKEYWKNGDIRIVSSYGGNTLLSTTEIGDNALYTPDTGNMWIRSALRDNYCLAIREDSTDLNKDTIMWTCNINLAHGWIITRDGMIRNEKSGLCLQPRDFGEGPVIQNICFGSDIVGTMWMYNKIDGTISNKHNGLCLSVFMDSSYDGSLVYVEQCDGSNRQKWINTIKLTTDHIINNMVGYGGYCMTCKSTNHNNFGSMALCLAVNHTQWTDNECMTYSVTSEYVMSLYNNPNNCLYELTGSLTIGNTEFFRIDINVPNTISYPSLLMNMPWLNGTHVMEGLDIVTVIPPSTYMCEESNTVTEFSSTNGLIQLISSSSNDTSIAGTWSIYVSKSVKHIVTMGYVAYDAKRDHIMGLNQTTPDISLFSTPTINYNPQISIFDTSTTQTNNMLIDVDLSDCSKCIIASGIGVPTRSLFKRVIPILGYAIVVGAISVITTVAAIVWVEWAHSQVSPNTIPYDNGGIVHTINECSKLHCKPNELNLNDPHIHNPRFIAARSGMKVDWSDPIFNNNKQFLSPIANQGFCGSCAIFSTVDTVEFIGRRSEYTIPRLSVEQILTCDWGKEYGWGCLGTTPSKNYRSMLLYGGITTDELYPYQAGGTDKNIRRPCQLDTLNLPMAIGIAGYLDRLYDRTSTNNNEKDMTLEVSKQPVMIEVYWGVNNPECVEAMNAYSDIDGGTDLIFYAPACAYKPELGHKLNHAIVVVGYGTLRDNFSNKDMEVWKIRNSQGSIWGIRGYMFIPRNINWIGLAERGISFPRGIALSSLPNGYNTLEPGNKLVSHTGAKTEGYAQIIYCRLTHFEPDGVVSYQTPGGLSCATDNNCKLKLLTDGNLAILNSNSVMIWSTIISKSIVYPTHTKITDSSIFILDNEKNVLWNSRRANNQNTKVYC